MKKKLDCILIIDDDDPTNFISEMLIEEAKCTEHVQIAQTGQIALNYLTNSDAFACGNKKFPCPDLIFLDINMPAMNGWEFLLQYHQLEQIHKGEIVIVMLTTSLNPDDSMKAEESSDISDFESKPLTTDKLNKILRKYFPANF